MRTWMRTLETTRARRLLSPGRLIDQVIQRLLSHLDAQTKAQTLKLRSLLASKTFLNQVWPPQKMIKGPPNRA